VGLGRRKSAHPASECYPYQICGVHYRGPLYPRRGSLAAGPGSPSPSVTPSPVSWHRPESLAVLEPPAYPAAAAPAAAPVYGCGTVKVLFTTVSHP
jgi:hypothetical protein